VGDSFTHLHVHTEFSMLDGAARLDELVARAVGDGQPALGITDHGNMYGVLDFYQQCQRHGIKPIIGTEAYMAHDHRSERPARRGRSDDSGGDTDSGNKLYYHLTLLAENGTGYRNLIQLASRAFLEGYWYKPRLDWELLADHADGVIAATGCLGGHVLQALLRGDVDGATDKAARLQDIFGRDNLFVELQDHGLPEQRRTNPQLIEVARRIGAPLLATNDSHYTHREDHDAHDALLCVQTGSVLSDPKRFKFDGEEHYLKTADEMRYLFRDHAEACDNTLWVAERANVEIEFGKVELPDFPLPEGFATADEYLASLTWDGARRRWGDTLSPEVVERINFELDTIAAMGFSAYFLIVWDLIAYARRNGIRVGPGRGSAAGCATAYTLEITDLDPIRYDLLFERFLNPSRISMPDIDMDFDSRYRDEMIRYAAERYGRDHVAQIITFGTIKARNGVRDAARVLGMPYAVGDRIAKAVPPLVMGRDTPLKYCFEPSEKYADGYKAASELRAMYDSDTDVKRVVDVATGLEGLKRSDGIHAAAVVITKEPLTTYLPVQRKPEPGQDPEQAPVVTQYEMHGVEDLGLLKMDFLGLRNLDVITDAVEMIRARHDPTFDIDHVPLDDAKTFEILQRGSGIGVFQLEGAPLRALMRSLRPTTFEDVAALVALYRPGPMAANMHNDYADRKNGRQPIGYDHPDLEQVLGDTYGLMIYQESVMRVAQRIAGYSLADADNLRRAAGKKKREVMAAEREKFVAGCERTGYGRDLGKKLFDIIEPFADYAFPRSHAFGYGLIAYQTAHLKANYPVEYLACLLTSVKSSLEKAAVYIAECRALGIKVLPPDVNRSVTNFAALAPDEVPDGVTLPVASPGAITFGLSAVRNVGEGLVAQLLAERDANGPFASFHDFADRVPEPVLNKRAVESLIKAGAFDSVGHPRRGLLGVFEQVTNATLSRRREREMGVMSLFGELGQHADGAAGDGYDERLPVPDVEFDKADLLRAEKEMLGLYVSDHPLFGKEAALRRKVELSIADLDDLDDGAIVHIGGIVTAISRRFTRRGDQMATFTLEDLEAEVEVTLFPRTLQEQGHKLTDDAVVAVRGRLDKRDESRPTVICQSLDVLVGLEEGAPTVTVRIPAVALGPNEIERLKRILATHPGPSPVVLDLGSERIRLADEFCVDLDRVVPELRMAFGHGAIDL
jgi:DNA polymerase-3 subunit alpha